MGCGLAQDRWEDRDAGGASRLGGEKGRQGAGQRKRRRRRWLGVTCHRGNIYPAHQTATPSPTTCGQGHRAPACVAGERRASGDRQWSWNSGCVCSSERLDVFLGPSVLQGPGKRGDVGAWHSQLFLKEGGGGRGEEILEKALPFAKAVVPLPLASGVCLTKSHGRPWVGRGWREGGVHQHAGRNERGGSSPVTSEKRRGSD